MAGALAILSCNTEKAVPDIPAVSERDAGTTVLTREDESPSTVLLKLDDDMVELVEAAGAEGNPLAEYGIESMERVFPDAGQWEPRTRKEGLHRYYVATLKENMTVTRAQNGLAQNEGVLAVRPERKFYLRSFDDPYLDRYQWNMINKRYPKADIGVQKVWEELTVGSQQVIVAVQDQGIDYNHPDLAGNMWTDGNGYHGYNFYNDTPDISFNLNGDSGHGTHIAGVIAAVNNNSTGICGIAGGDYGAGIPGVRLMSCQIFSKGYSASVAACARAIKWGADHGAVISQNSWGDSADYNGDGYVEDAELEYYKQFGIIEEIKEAIDYFIKYAGCDNDGNQLPDSPMKGGLVIFASGNEAIDYDPICSYDPVISVGAYGGSGLRASYSNYGDWVDLCAPGGDGSFYIYSTVPGDKYKNEMGTSMACPHVSGIAALLVSYFGGQGFTAAKCREYLINGAIDNFITDTRKVGRKVDAYNSFVYAGAAEPVNHDPNLSFAASVPPSIASHETVSVALNASDPDGDELHISTKETVDGISVVKEGSSYYLRIEALRLDEDRTYNVTITAEDGMGGTATVSADFRVLANNAPALKEPLSDIQTLPGATFTTDLARYFTDKDGEDLAYTATVTGATAEITAAVNGHSLVITPGGYGSARIEVKATDARGKEAVTSFRLAIRDSSSPVFVYPLKVESVTSISTDSEIPVPVSVTINGAAGNKVFDKSVDSGLFDEAVLDLSGLAPGLYLINVTYNGNVYKKTLVKI